MNGKLFSVADFDSFLEIQSRFEIDLKVAFYGAPQ